MTPEQVGQILAAAAGRDARTVGLADVLAWHEDIGDLDYDDALAAVGRHYRESTDRLMPAHVRRIAADIRRERQRGTAVDAQRAIEADPTRRDRSAEVEALIADVRSRLKTPPRDALRRPEVARWDRERERTARWLHAVPNPHYDPTLFHAEEVSA